ncbi:glycosyl hydrolase [Mycena rosella]|uniref:Glycosyl hydrolase n=1 Tax=Mycena rosella TaxID=1033263 RepID=A0AAD7D9C0_MYCRO|nr:glycosyl hydrolase [Mycena rosella]
MTGSLATPVSGSPTLCKLSGLYYIFTGGVGIPIYTSKDLVAWSKIGTVWPNCAPGTDTFTGVSNGKLWAPDCQVIDGKFHLFYAASSLGSRNVLGHLLCIFNDRGWRFLDKRRQLIPGLDPVP